MKAKSLIKLGIVVLLVVVIGFLAVNGLQFGKTKYSLKPVSQAISLGLDLSGGIQTTYQVVDTSVENYDALLTGTVAALRNRLTTAGYTEATVAIQGSDKIRVEIPDVSDPEAVMDIIGTPAHLEFRDPEGNVIIEGKDLKTCGVVSDGEGTYQVAFELNSTGTAAFAAATQQWLGSTISIYLDNECISSPTVQSVISSGSGTISLGIENAQESYDEATRLVTLLQSGALPLDIRESETRAISATLGIEAIDGALIAGLIGLILIIVFMIALYRLPGIAASLALLIYILIVLYTMAILGTQLTLQGIAGILLGIGMAVDANVIIFERFREELKVGRTPMNALTFGYKNALTAILDSNVTTLIAAVVLLYFGTGSVKGFASTLLISVIASLITAVFITRFLLRQIIRLNVKNLAWYTR